MHFELKYLHRSYCLNHLVKYVHIDENDIIFDSHSCSKKHMIKYWKQYSKTIRWHYNINN